MMYNTPKLCAIKLRSGTPSEDNRAKTQELMKRFMENEAKLRQYCREKGIEVPKLMC